LQIKDSAVESLLQVFKVQGTIRRLILKNCRLTSSSGIMIARAIKDGLPLALLDLGNSAMDSNANVFNGVVGAAFAGAIISSSTLEDLGLQGTQLCTTIKGKRDTKFEAAICMQEALRVSKVLRHEQSHFQRANKRFLYMSQVIQRLWLGSNGFGKDGGPIILNAICESRSLVSFDVSGNDMDSSISLVLQSCLSACASLQVRYRLKNGHAFQHTSTLIHLQHFSLSNNKIGHVAAAALSRGISSSRLISRLELACCNIGDKGAFVRQPPQNNSRNPLILEQGAS
jgi:hypothetical protein